jgi:hypothetical protein
MSSTEEKVLENLERLDADDLLLAERDWEMRIGGGDVLLILKELAVGPVPMAPIDCLISERLKLDPMLLRQAAELVRWMRGWINYLQGRQRKRLCELLESGRLKFKEGEVLMRLIFSPNPSGADDELNDLLTGLWDGDDGDWAK